MTAHAANPFRPENTYYTNDRNTKTIATFYGRRLRSFPCPRYWALPKEFKPFLEKSGANTKTGRRRMVRTLPTFKAEPEALLDPGEEDDRENG